MARIASTWRVAFVVFALGAAACVGGPPDAETNYELGDEQVADPDPSAAAEVETEGGTTARSGRVAGIAPRGPGQMMQAPTQ